MTLDDPEVLEKPTPNTNHRPAGYCGVPFQMKSLFCRNGRCSQCIWRTCECECHKRQAEELRRLRAELER